MTRTELQGQVTSEMKDSGLGSGVSIGALLAQCANSKASNTRCDDDARRVLKSCLLLQQGRKQLDGVKDSSDVEVHDLGKGIVRVSIELLAPCSSCIGEQDIDVIGVLADLLKERLDAFNSSGIGGDGDSLGTRLEVGKSVQRLDGLLTGLCLARGDEDLGGPGLKETRDSTRLTQKETMAHRQRTYAEAALRPRPRDPPVTTATLPLREKRVPKLFN